MPIVLPDAAALAGVGANELALAGIAPAKIAEAVAGRGGEVVLIVRLVWDDQRLRWNSDWQLDWQGKSKQWQLAAISFDRPFGKASVLPHRSLPGSSGGRQFSGIVRQHQTSGAQFAHRGISRSPDVQLHI